MSELVFIDNKGKTTRQPCKTVDKLEADIYTLPTFRHCKIMYDLWHLGQTVAVPVIGAVQSKPYEVDELYKAINGSAKLHALNSGDADVISLGLAAFGNGWGNIRDLMSVALRNASPMHAQFRRVSTLAPRADFLKMNHGPLAAIQTILINPTWHNNGAKLSVAGIIDGSCRINELRYDFIKQAMKATNLDQILSSKPTVAEALWYLMYHTWIENPECQWHKFYLKVLARRNDTNPTSPGNRIGAIHAANVQAFVWCIWQWLADVQPGFGFDPHECFRMDEEFGNEYCSKFGHSNRKDDEDKDDLNDHRGEDPEK